MLKIFVDGAARPNPGLGGIGVVIYRGDEKVLEAYQFMGKNKNHNQMEFVAAVNGLSFAIQMFGCIRAELFTDSELVYGSILPTSDIKHKNIKNEKLVGYYNALEEMLTILNTHVYHVTEKMNKHYLKYIKQAHDLAQKAVINKKSMIKKIKP